MSTTRYIETGEGKISIEDTGGKGKPVLCVPGMGDGKSVYRFLAGGLSKKGYRAITMDLRGMGESSVKWSDYSEASIANDIISVIEQLELKSPILIGNSISAGAAVIASSRHPDLISRLVLVSPFARNVPISRFKLIFLRLALCRPWGAAMWAGYQSKRLYPSVKPADMAAYSASIKAMLLEKGRMRAFQKMAATNHDEAEKSLENIRVPVLIIMGSKDPDFPDPNSEADWLAKKTGAKSVMIDGAGHYPQAEFPEEFLNHLIGFIGE